MSSMENTAKSLPNAHPQGDKTATADIAWAL